MQKHFKSVVFLPECELQVFLATNILKLQELGAKTTPNNLEIVSSNEVVYIAVKPNMVEEILREVSPKIRPENLIISIAAGVTTKSMEQVSF